MATLHDTALGSADGAGTSLATTDALAVTAGDLIVVLFKYEGASNTFVAGDCTDGVNTYSLAVGNVFNGDLGGVMFYATAATTTTVSPAVASLSRSWRRIKAYSFTPAANKTLEIGNTTSTTGASSGSASIGPLSATAAGATVAGYCAYGDISLSTPTSGWSNATEFSSAQPVALVTEYTLQSGSGSLTSDPVTTGTLDWCGMMAVFNEATVGPAAITRYNSFSEYVADGSIDLDTDSFKVRMVTGYTPSATHTQLSEVPAAMTGTTDTLLSSITWAQTSGTAKFDAADTVVLFSSNGTPGHAIIYDDTSASDLLVAYITLGSTTITAGNSMRLVWGTNGIFTLN